MTETLTRNCNSRNGLVAASSGAVAFAGLAAVVLPMVMDEEPKQSVQDVRSAFPVRTGAFQSGGTGRAGDPPPLPWKPQLAGGEARPQMRRCRLERRRRRRCRRSADRESATPPENAEKPAVKKVATPPEKISDKAADRKVVKPTEKTSEKAPEKTVEKKVVKPAEKVPEKPVDKKVAKPVEKRRKKRQAAGQESRQARRDSERRSRQAASRRWPWRPGHRLKPRRQNPGASR
jgi:DedD protein